MRQPADQPRFIKPMECTPVAEVVADRKKWIYEVKLDGYRCCAVVSRGRAHLYSRYGNLWPERFPEIRAALADLPDVVLDGEIVAVDAKGRPSFQELQNWQSTRHRIVFYAFDLLHLEGRDLRALRIESRKDALDRLGESFADPLRLSAALDAPLGRLVSQMKKIGLEGIVAKRRGSRYEAGRRSASWLKHRFNETGEFVIGGYIPEEDTFGRLLIGVWRGDDLVYVKKLKNGFTPHSKKQVFDAIRPLRTRKCPFVNVPDEPAVWVKPMRMVEVEFVEWTRAGNLRHAAFRKLVQAVRE